MSGVFESARGLPVRPVAERYTRLDARGNGPCPFCGGTDRFFVRKDGLRWGCRKCGRHGDAIDLAAEMEGVSKAEAARMLAGGSAALPAAPRGRPKPADPPSRTDPVRDAGTMERLARAMEEAERLMPGSPAERYCLARGLRPETVRAFRLGCSRGRDGSPRVSIPWVDEKGRVCAVKLRAASDGVPKNARYSSEKGSRPSLFGLHLAPKRALVLLAFEGEFNCMAAWQALRAYAGVCVVSVGSEGGRGIAMLPALASLLGARFGGVWMDDPEKAAQAAEAMRRAGVECEPMRSPDGMDAADILRRHGAQTLARMLRVLVPGLIPAEERYEDGYDPFADPGSEERAPERLWARLLSLGCTVGLDAKGRLRIGNPEGVPEWMRESVREDRAALEDLLRRLGPQAEHGPGGYVGSALWALTMRCVAAFRQAERDGLEEAGRLADILERADRARAELRPVEADPEEVGRLLEAWERWRARAYPPGRDALRALGLGGRK